MQVTLLLNPTTTSTTRRNVVLKGSSHLSKKPKSTSSVVLVTPGQNQKLLKVFNTTGGVLTNQAKATLAKDTGLSRREVQTWFHAQRALSHRVTAYSPCPSSSSSSSSPDTPQKQLSSGSIPGVSMFTLNLNPCSPVTEHLSHQGEKSDKDSAKFAFVHTYFNASNNRLYESAPLSSLNLDPYFNSNLDGGDDQGQEIKLETWIPYEPREKNKIPPPVMMTKGGEERTSAKLFQWQLSPSACAYPPC